ncbi:MAG: GerMN domain-containing protein [Eubacterium sp.]|jgi:germination protein M|nr:GerMN domain-containing protein [Eubacterium sp.]
MEVSMGKRCILLFVFLLASCVLGGCGKDSYDHKKGEFRMYRIADDGMGLKSTKYHTMAESDDTVGVVADLLANYEAVDVREFEIKERQLFVYFSSAYYSIEGIDEVLWRAAIVKTLCQVDGIEYIEFFVEKDSLEIDGEPVGAMSELSFLDSIGGDGYTQDKYVTLFFADISGAGMKEVTARLTYDMTEPLATLLIEQLLAGPEKIEGVNTSDVRKTIPDGTVLNSLSIRDNICYVDFSKEFLNVQAQVKSEIVIYSIVNTLCELPDVNRVQFTIDGEQKQDYSDSKNFDAPFERNLDLVSGGSKG